MAVAVIRLAALRTAVLAALVPAHGVLAQTALLDPTRPANSAMYATTVAGVEPGPSGAGVLQSVLHVPGRKPRALIDGQWLEQGQLFGDLRVAKVTGNSVILVSAGGGKEATRQEIMLTPGIQKARPVKKTTQRVVETK
ncbi:MAG: hypothetical protein IPH08_02340 [Rhodocyclaceae bacterium]|nr:hypothetical protein [Rhodocyclaceae bacterium]MBK6906006.1 hypothetical protein [Rhodocyclaceae bacterium]